MKRSLQIVQQFVDNFLNQSFDGIAVLLMIQMTQAFRAIMQKRKIGVLNAYFEELLAKLWPRFNQIYEKNLESIQTASPLVCLL